MTAIPNFYPFLAVSENRGESFSVKEVSVLVGGKAGDGINNAGAMIARMFSRLGYYVFMYYDYPSLIRGGHNFAIVRASDQPVTVHQDRADFILALDQETVDLHQSHCPGCTLVINSDRVKPVDGAVAVSLASLLAAEAAPPIMGNSAMLGAFAKTAGVPWETVESVFVAHMPKSEQNLRVARRAYDLVQTVRPVEPLHRAALPLLTGNEAVGLGLVSAGLAAYVSYPMTPSSSLLHFLAEQQERFSLKVVHPENEIAVILMALGFAYAGTRTAVGTSGGGFCLMTEGLSFAGMAEFPVVIVMSQRTGPSTGLPTYSGQADLHFVRSAGQGEFPRLVVAPADADEAYAWSKIAMDCAWAFQVPAFILIDKMLSEGTYSFTHGSTHDGTPAEPARNDPAMPYARYRDMPDGISPLAFPGTKGAIVKANSYAHDEDGITTEESAVVLKMAHKRMRKEEQLVSGLDRYRTVNVLGTRDASTALLCWGSTRGTCGEAAAHLGLRVVQPVVLSPFPERQVKEALSGATRVIAVEENATGQLAAVARQYGIPSDAVILKYDGRPFTPDELYERIQEVMHS